MPTPAAPDVAQFGFTTALGALQNLADGNDATFWAPYADGLDGYIVPPVSDAGLVLPGYPRPAIQFDFGDRVRAAMFKPRTFSPTSLGEAYLIASDLPATSINNTVQDGDLYAGFFTLAQMNGNTAVQTRAATQNIRGRFWRFIFIKQPAIA